MHSVYSAYKYETAVFLDTRAALVNLPSPEEKTVYIWLHYLTFKEIFSSFPLTLTTTKHLHPVV